MGKFLEGNKLNVAIEELYKQATQEIIIVSPFIKLHDRLKSILRYKKQFDDTRISVLFGKNENDITKSFTEEDFNFFKDFPNIDIMYEKRLHAKFYANEFDCIVTSLNLYDYSQNNNIEAGYQTNDSNCFDYFSTVLDQAESLYQVTPNYESKMFGLSSKYTGSVITIDQLSGLYKGKTLSIPKVKIMGYCIRTGVSIPFNIKKPMSRDAYKKWNEFGNMDYVEKYCHFTGEESNSETSMRSPIMRKNYKKAKETVGF